MALFERRVFARIVADITVRAVHARDPQFDDARRSALFNRFFDLVTVQKAVPHLLIGGFAILLQSGIGLVLTSFYHPFFLAFNLLVASLLLGIWLLWVGPALRSAAALSHAKHETASWLESVGRSNGFYKDDRRLDFAMGRSETMTAAYVRAHRRHFRHTFAQTIGFLLIYAVASAGLLALGGWLILQGQLSLGQLVAAELVLSGAFYGLSQLAPTWKPSTGWSRHSTNWRSSKGSSRRTGRDNPVRSRSMDPCACVRSRPKVPVRRCDPER